MSDIPDGERPQRPVRTERRERRVYRGGIFWPILLVAIGVIFLLRNVGALSGDAWDNVLKLWPILLIAIGLDSLYRREGVAGAVFWVGLGVVFLLANLGLFAWNVWDVVFNLWPVLLIAIGLDIVLGRRSTWGAVLAMLIVVAVLAGALWLMGGSVTTGQVMRGEEIGQPLEGATEAVVVLKPAVGSIHIAALPKDAKALVAGMVQERNGETVRQDFKVSEGKANYNLHTDGFSGFYTPGRRRGPDWDLALSPSIPLDIQVGMGAGEMVVDLSELQVSQLDVELGVGRSVITLPKEGQFEAEISGAVGETVIIIPEGMQVRVESDTALSAVEAPGSLQKEGDIYTTSGYETASSRINLHISQAIGKITIQMAR